MSQKVLLTGSAGFIGFHTANALLAAGFHVTGFDNMSEYYDVRIKQKRLSLLKKNKRFNFVKCDIANYKAFEKACVKFSPDHIVHLAAQAGVRYSLVNPWVYSDANYLGTLNVFEYAKRAKLARVIYASSSSVYGGNEKQPFAEDDRTDRPLSVYAATKRANELLAYSYNHLYGIEMVGLRFFTVYGPWGRPDMALFKFVKNIAAGKPIDLYNNGKMTRSFTYVDDITEPIVRLVKQKPESKNKIYNLGGVEGVPLKSFVAHIEKELGKKAILNMMPLQQGDVPDTIADCTKEERELGFKAQVGIEEGIRRFVVWFKENEKFVLSLKQPKQ